MANTAVNAPGGHCFEELSSPETTTGWLAAHGLVPSRTTLQPYCQNQLTGLRANVRAAFSAHVDNTVPLRDAVDGINRAFTVTPSIPLLQHDSDHGFHRRVEHPVTRLVEHAMSRIAHDAVMLLTGDQAGALAQCQASP